jgi:ribosomal protein L11 methyltransferase
MLSPHQLLHIYYFKGHLVEDVIGCSNSFIGNWEEDGFSFLFFSRPAGNAIEKIIEANPQMTLLDEYRMTYAEWHGGTFSPVAAGPFVIVPAWEASEQKLEAAHGLTPIVIDPGVVFGSGMHPTTLGCLEALGLAFGSSPMATVVDLGTGSGILAVAAARLGAGRVLAVDNNRLAVKTAKTNIALNGLGDAVLAVQGRAENFIDVDADLLIANIHYDILRRIIETDGFLKKKMFILSGLLRSEARDVDLRFSRLPVKRIQTWEHDHIWHTVWGEVSQDIF